LLSFHCGSRCVCKRWVALNSGLGSADNIIIMHFNYCPWIDSIKPILQNVYICRVRCLSIFLSHLFKYQSSFVCAMGGYKMSYRIFI
jgi:hypothetical protein